MENWDGIERRQQYIVLNIGGTETQVPLVPETLRFKTCSICRQMWQQEGKEIDVRKIGRDMTCETHGTWLTKVADSQAKVDRALKIYERRQASKTR